MRNSMSLNSQELQLLACAYIDRKVWREGCRAAQPPPDALPRANCAGLAAGKCHPLMVLQGKPNTQVLPLS